MRHAMKSMVSVVVVACAALSTVPSQAADQVQNAGTLGGTPYVTSFTHGMGESFLDTLNFDVASGGTLSVSLTDLFAQVSSMVLFDNVNLSGSLWDAHHPNGLVNFGSVPADGLDHTFVLPGAGSYHLDFSGEAVGLGGGVYAVGLAMAPVPEPQGWALMALGLGVLGAYARRRAKVA